MTRMLATVVSVDENRRPTILLDGSATGGEVAALRAGGYNPHPGDRCVVTKVGMRFIAEYAVDGPLGAGLSAYEIAVANGFGGTEAEWLASLHGAAGQAGQNGRNGQDGASAYEVAVENGFGGTEAEWLASLHGADGAGADVFSSGFAPFTCDFLNGTYYGNAPLVGMAVNSGTCDAGASDPNHPGVTRLLSSSNPYSGFRFTTAPGALVIAGGERFEAVFRVHNTIQGCLHKLGLHDADSYLMGGGGICLEIFPETTLQAAVRGWTNSGGAWSRTATSLSIGMLTWYRMRIEVNAVATVASFKLYAEDGTLLWSDSLSENLPVEEGRAVGVSVLATRNGVSASPLLYIDRVSFEIDRELVR